MRHDFGELSETVFTHPLSSQLRYTEAVREVAPDWVLTTVALAVAGKLIHANEPSGVLRIMTLNGQARLKLEADGRCLRNIFPVKTDLSDGELTFQLDWDGYRAVMQAL